MSGFNYQKQKVFTLSSKDRNQGTPDSFEIDAKIPQRNNWNRISLMSYDILKSWYMFQGITNNGINFQENGGSVREALLDTNRNYTAEELAVEIATKLTAESARVGNAWTYTCVYDEGTGKFTMGTNNGTWTYNLSFLVGDPRYRLQAKYLGMIPNVAHASVLRISDGFNIITSDYPANLQRYDYITIRSNLALNNNDSVLGRVYPSGTPPFGRMIQQTDDFIGGACEVNTSSLNNPNFQLIGDDNKPVNMNNADWSLTFTMFKDKGDEF